MRWAKSGNAGRLRRGAVRYSVLAATVATLLGVFLWSQLSVTTCLPMRCDVAGTTLKAFDQNGRLCWSRELPGLDSEFYKSAPIPVQASPDGVWVQERVLDYGRRLTQLLLADVDRDGSNEVLFNFVPRRMPEKRGKLICFDEEGSVPWTFEYGRSLTFKGRPFDASYSGRMPRIVDSEKNTTS